MAVLSHHSTQQRCLLELKVVVVVGGGALPLGSFPFSGNAKRDRAISSVDLDREDG